MGPHNLPLRAMPLIGIRVPVPLSRDVTTSRSSALPGSELITLALLELNGESA